MDTIITIISILSVITASVTIFCLRRIEKLNSIKLDILMDKPHLYKYTPSINIIKPWNLYYPNYDTILKEAELKYKYFKLLKEKT